MMITEESLARTNLKWSTWISDSYKFVYIDGRKAGSTSMLAMLHAIVDDVPKQESLYTPSTAIIPELDVHDNRIYTKLRQVSTLEEILALANQQYYIFTTIRDPVTRIFSVWSSKILAHEGSSYPRFISRYPGKVANSTFSLDEDMVRYIRKTFEDHLVFLRKVEFPVFRDAHWRRQKNELLYNHIPYTKIVDVTDLKDFCTQFTKRLGVSIPPSVPRLNTSAVPYHSDYITTTSADLIFEMYDEDFTTFNYPKVVPISMTPAPIIDARLLRMVISEADRIWKLLEYIDILAKKERL